MKKLLPLILSTLLLTSCSGPDSSGGVEFSKTANAFPYGDCRGSGYQTHSTESTGCGWFTAHEKNYYMTAVAHLFHADLSGADLNGATLMFANLSHANLTNANLSHANLFAADLNSANLSNANLSGTNLYGVQANSSTTCPNGINYGTSGNNCGF